jgi:hypothetical protein
VNPEPCLCGNPGCLGHERVDHKVYVPGFTSQEAMDACPNEIVYFDHALKAHVHEAVRKFAIEEGRSNDK